MGSAGSLVVCHDCDLLHRPRALPPGGVARCVRCGGVLYRRPDGGLERTLALTLAALILFIIANVFPFMAFKLEGRMQESTLVTGVIELYRGGLWGVSAVVLATSIAVPFLKLAGMLYLLMPLRLGRRPWRLPLAFRVVKAIGTWAMTEVYMLGVLVAFVKLSDIATVVLDAAVYSFGGFILLTTAASASFDPDRVWEWSEALP